MVNEPTKEELAILGDTSFLLRKHSLSDKVVSYLSQIERALHEAIGETPFDFPQGSFLKAGKIAKGEQYKQLPYFILDYPRLFTQKEVFAFRTMLWWGHHFSCTLHMAGDFLQHKKESLFERISDEKDLYFCVNDQPWHYHYEPNNYLSVSDLNKSDMEKHVKEHGFVKISNKIPVSDWKDYKSFTLQSFARFLMFVK